MRGVQVLPLEQVSESLVFLVFHPVQPQFNSS